MRARSLVGRGTAAFGLMLLVSTSLGCAQYATIRQPRPALVSTPIRRVAIMELKPQRGEGRHAVDALWTTLHKSGRFELVPQGHLQQFATMPIISSSGAPDRNAAIRAGRQMGVDALLIVYVQFLEADGTLYGSKTIRIGDPDVVAAAQYELIDLRSGQILDRNVMKSRPYMGELTSDPSGPTAEGEVLSKLAFSCGAKVAHLLLPHEEIINVELAHSTLGPGSSQVRKGMAAAQAGDWEEARQYWLTAIEANPKNDAANYNLALAHEALGDFLLARRALDAAAHDKPNALAKEALARVDRAAAEMRLTQQLGSQRFARPRLAGSQPLPRSGYAP